MKKGPCRGLAATGAAAPVEPGIGTEPDQK
jgi:hypothetical protein